MINRRKFLNSTGKAIGSIALLNIIPGVSTAINLPPQHTVQQVIDIILKAGNLNPAAGTVDTIKAGNADQPVTGIVTTMFATTDVINQAVKLGANFIIAHEPTFYNHTDDKDLVKDNPVVKEKLDLLNRHKITVWRFHDGLHSLNPDPVGYGFLQKTGWLKYYKDEQYSIQIPAVSLQQMVQHLKKSLGIQHVRVIGDLNLQCRKVTVIPGAAGGKWQMSAVVADNPDVLIVGEVSEWETAEFIRDSNAQGRKKALIILGHALSEEPGMECLVSWLQPKLPGIKITHIASGEPFTWM
ncbi:Nif3-like dinuclear metal center hexameric protein [Mucilaginibacter litoreus]|uniref:Nif3-like dinuclear metal center hexameric protein n=1 Tax=Mucilaginibacter litoreus TaxID=1048221 RepID=A0ABW3AVP9_9SPHI